jgi:subtilisin family serine protease
MKPLRALLLATGLLVPSFLFLFGPDRHPRAAAPARMPAPPAQVSASPVSPAPSSAPRLAATTPIAMSAQDFAAWRKTLPLPPSASEGRLLERFIQGRTLATPSGEVVSRVAIVERPDFKTPLIRLEQSRDPQTGRLEFREMVATQLLVRVRPDAPAAELDDLLARAGATASRPVGSRGIRLVEVPADRIENFDTALAVLASPTLALSSAGPDFIVYGEAPVTPNDPSFNVQWNFHNTGQSSGTADADIDAPEAWGITTGNPSTVVALLDTGLDYLHPDLAPNLWLNPGESGGGKETNGIDDDANGYVDDVRGWDFYNNDNAPLDDNSHGTHVAGILGARSNNSTGVAGLNWNVKLMPLKFLSSTNTGATSDALAALDYALSQGVRLSNNSWGGSPYSAVFADLLADAAALDHLFVASAGNNTLNTDTNPSYPGSYPAPNVVAVAATDRKDLIASFSNFGATRVDLAAPGVAITSTTLMDPAGTPTYGSKNGSSQSAPHVTGAAALVLGLAPGISHADLKQLLLETVDPLAGLAGKMVSGGRLNAGRAVTQAQDGIPLLRITSIDDDNTGGSSGNANGIAEPGETVDYTLELRNPWSTPLALTSLSFAESSAHLTLALQPALPATLPAGASVTLAGPLRVVIAPGATTPLEYPVTATLGRASGPAWDKVLRLAVRRVYTLSGTVTLDGAGVAGATVNVAPEGAQIVTDSLGYYSLPVTDTPRYLHATMPGAWATAVVTVQPATQSGPVNFAFTTRTISGVVRDTATNLPVTDGRTVFFFIGASQQNWDDRFNTYLQTPLSPAGEYSFTYIFGRDSLSTLYLDPLPPYWQGLERVTLSTPSATQEIPLSRSELTASPSSHDLEGLPGVTQSFNLLLSPVDTYGIYRWHVRFQNGRRQSASPGAPSPGTPLRLLESSATPGPRLDPALPTETTAYDTLDTRLVRVDGLRNEVKVFHLETGALLQTWELPNSPSTPISASPDPSLAAWYPTECEIDRATGWLWIAGTKRNPDNSEPRGWLLALDLADGTLKRSFTLQSQPIDLAITADALFAVLRNRTTNRDEIAEINRTTGAVVRQSTLNARNAYRVTTSAAHVKYLGSPEGLWVVSLDTATHTVFLDLVATANLNVATRLRRVNLGAVTDLPGGAHYPDALHNIFFSPDHAKIYTVAQDLYLTPPTSGPGGLRTLREFRFGVAADSWIEFPVGEGFFSVPTTSATIAVQLRGDRLAPGTYLADLVIDTNTLVSPRLVVPVRFKVLSAYDEWTAAIAWGGRDSSPAADPNGNGLPNHLEYLLARDPLATDSPIFSRQEVEDDALVFEFTRLKDAPALVQSFSTDLVVWSPATPDGVLITEEILSSTATTETLRLRLVLDGRPRLFFRFEAADPAE